MTRFRLYFCSTWASFNGEYCIPGMAMRRKRISASRCASIPVMSCPFMKRLYSAAKDGCAITHHLPSSESV